MAGACGKILTLWLLVLSGHSAMAQGCTKPVSEQSVISGNLEFKLVPSGDFWPLLNSTYNGQYQLAANDTVDTILNCGSLWMAGKDSAGQVRAAANMYPNRGNDYFPGPLNDSGTTTYTSCQDWDKFFTINRQQVIQQKALAAQYNTAQGGTIPLQLVNGHIRNWPGAGNPYFTAPAGHPIQLDSSKPWAPFVDMDGNGLYDPTKGDYPVLRGGQSYWWIFNEAGGPHSVTNSGQMGIQGSVFAYTIDTIGPVGQTSFYEVTLLSPASSYDSFYFGLFIDFALGYTFSNYFSCDTSRDMGIGLKAYRIDINYGADPPQLGVRYLSTPDGPNGHPMGMSQFRLITTGPGKEGWPYNPLEFWYALQSRWLDGSYQTYGGNGMAGSVPFPWAMPDEPEDTLGWSECNLGNTAWSKPFLMSSGPYHLEAGKPLSFTFAVISAACTGTWDGKCHRRHCIQQASDEVHDFFKAQRPVGISETGEVTHHPKLYPNPTEGLLHINWPEASTGGTLELLNHTGQRVAAWPAPVTQIHIGHLPAGWYLLRFQNSRETWQAPVVKY